MSTPDRSSVGRYELREKLGAGGMGTVWHAWDPSLQRDVAIKEVLLPESMDPDERAEAHARTLREAQATARISHPAVVTVHDVLEHEGNPWIVMELLSGTSLQHHLDHRGPLSAERAEEAARSLLEGLRAAHGVGVTHRDIKPANVMFTDDDRTVLTDFGIANVDGGTALTQTGVYIGSPEYMAPERFEGERALPASDLWSLGVTLYALLEGRSPFKRDSITGIISAVLTTPMPPPLSGGEDPGRAPLRALIGALLERDAASRPDPDEALALLEREKRAEGREASATSVDGTAEAGPPADHPTSGPQYPVSGPQRPVSGPQYPVSGPQHPVSGPQRPVSGPQYPVSGPQHPVGGPPRPGPSGPPPGVPHSGAGMPWPGNAAHAAPPPPMAGPGRPSPGGGPPTGRGPLSPGGANTAGPAGAPFGPGGAPGSGGQPSWGRPRASMPASVIAAAVMLGLSALYAIILAVLFTVEATNGTSNVNAGSLIQLYFWGLLAGAASLSLGTRSRLVYGGVVLMQIAVSVLLILSMFTVLIYSPEQLLLYSAVLVFNLVIAGLLLIPARARSYFRFGTGFD